MILRIIIVIIDKFCHTCSDYFFWESYVFWLDNCLKLFLQNTILSSGWRYLAGFYLHSFYVTRRYIWSALSFISSFSLFPSVIRVLKALSPVFLKSYSLSHVNLINKYINLKLSGQHFRQADCKWNLIVPVDSVTVFSFVFFLFCFFYGRYCGFLVMRSYSCLVKVVFFPLFGPKKKKKEKKVK